MGSRPPTLDTNTPTKMLPLVVLSALFVVSSAAPGGYTGLGGLYKNMNQNADYMPHAKNAAKLATQIAFEEDESLVGGQAVRPARRASVYVPTFFTSEPQPNVADASLPQLQRINRQLFERTDKDNSKKKTKEGMTDVFLCRQKLS